MKIHLSDIQIVLQFQFRFVEVEFTFVLSFNSTFCFQFYDPCLPAHPSSFLSVSLLCSFVGKHWGEVHVILVRVTSEGRGQGNFFLLSCLSLC